jgi:hypothetical protein
MRDISTTTRDSFLSAKARAFKQYTPTTKESGRASFGEDPVFYTVLYAVDRVHLPWNPTAVLTVCKNAWNTYVEYETILNACYHCYVDFFILI